MERQFGLWTAVSMVVGLMIGAGIFVLPSQLAPFGWTSAAGWIVVGAGALAIARVIAELHVKYPLEPSVMTISGDILGLLAARLIALSYWVGLVVAAAIVAIAALAYSYYRLAGQGDNLAAHGLLSFAADQEALDNRIRSVLARA